MTDLHTPTRPSRRSRPIRDAVILAAGNGSRLSSVHDSPKPVRDIRGRAMLARVMDGLEGAGCTRIHIVVGFGADAVRACPGVRRDGLDIRWIDNPRYHEPNGVSLLACRDLVSAPFLLTMGDHLFDPTIVREFAAEPLAAADGVLAVDQRIASVFDEADATRVMEASGLIVAIGKNIEPYNAIDAGLFALTSAVFEAMARSYEEGDGSLTGGIRTLARHGGMRVWDLGRRPWIDVDTPEAVAYAERLVSRHGDAWHQSRSAPPEW